MLRYKGHIYRRSQKMTFFCFPLARIAGDLKPTQADPGWEESSAVTLTDNFDSSINPTCIFFCNVAISSKRKTPHKPGMSMQTPHKAQSWDVNSKPQNREADVLTTSLPWSLTMFTFMKNLLTLKLKDLFFFRNPTVTTRCVLCASCTVYAS